MPPRPSPSMPTQKQIADAFEMAKQLCPGVRIKGVGPDGVIFEYPDPQNETSEWSNQPFSGDA